MPPQNEFNFDDRRTFRDMVGWFDAPVLLDALKRSIVSALFGSYADRRLTRAALDEIAQIKSGEDHRTDFRGKLDTIGKNEIWIDYVADLGDGFNSTYAIAYLIGLKELNFPEGQKLPRAQVLVMGGDEVYPTPTKNEYKTRMEMPYQYAHPDTKPDTPLENSDNKHPLLFMIPGNHDWYDGLTLFLAKFCRREGGKLGNWRLHQTRSYFAIRISDDWWIWGSDTQLAEDVDQSQAEYFIDIAKRMEKETPHARAILCSSVPTWTKADDEDDDHQKAFSRGIDYIATAILKKYCPGAKIYTVLSGDQHHYSRYIDKNSGTNFITSGGGGAFLHPTHHLKNEIKNINWRGALAPLDLAQKDENYTKAGEDRASCFPDRATSRKLAWGNLKFPVMNWHFSCALGAVYAMLSLLLSLGVSMSGHALERGADLITSPLSFLVWIFLIVAISLQVDYSRRFHRIKNVPFISDKWIAAIAHGTCHFLVLSLLYYFLSPIGASSEWGFMLFLTTIVIGGCLIGAFVWGLYLACSSYFFARHYNDSFSAMRLQSFKNFLRLHIKGDALTIYPIGIENVPNRKGWKLNKNRAKGNGDESVILPITPIQYRLIEAPVVIRPPQERT